MCCVAEAMGISLPGSATIPATYADRLRVAQASGRQIVELVKTGVTARQIINQKGIENGIRLSTAIGGSTNVALHIPAIGYEADCEITMALFEDLCRSTPHIAKMNPAASPNVPDFHQAGGVSAVMKELLPILHGDAQTVTGKTVAENVASVAAPNRTIIKTIEDPWHKEGGLAVLQGNLAPHTAVTKPAAIQQAANGISIPGNELVVPWAGIKFSTSGDEIGQNVLGSGLIGQYQKGSDGKISLEIVYPFDVASANMVYPFPQF